MNYCPQCSSSLSEVVVEGERYSGCPEKECDFVHWNNPTPVVAMIVEVEGGVVMAHNASWTHQFYSIITGFLEEGEDPVECAHRETKEELGLDASECNLIGAYGFAKQNQVIIAYHMKAEGKVILNDELDDYKIVPISELKGWDMGTGLAINDWLASQQ
ncbi:NUDIX domain-containing protein [Halieaceae bacterium]|jgi:NADH pyrophosphatase NudC (nudix superfamily)|nr:NUDIX domain-containing protein [Halieaceae bacterium]